MVWKSFVNHLLAGKMWLLPKRAEEEGLLPPLQLLSRLSRVRMEGMENERAVLEQEEEEEEEEEEEGGGNAVGDGVNISDMQRFHKTRPCKKYFSELGCPYGDRCNFLHDEQTPQPKVPRESVVITVASSAGASGSGGGGGVGGVAGGTANLRPPNWKTRLCNKWETTGNCPFGDKCHFAHGTAELQKYGGGPFDPTAEMGSGVQVDSKFVLNQSSNFLDGDDVFFSSFGDGYGQVMNVRQSTAASIQQNSRLNQGPGVGYKSLGGWKGPTDRISTIYGDWVEDEEWEQSPVHVIKSAQQQVQPNQAYQEAADYPQSEIGPTRDRGGLSTSYGMYSNGQEVTGQKSSLNQGNGFTSSSRVTRLHAQGLQGADMAYAAQERGSDNHYNGTQGWGGEL
ncbi:hypothetical protein MARPO_0121s0050 [Marchantia polymorpha]|uniref:C3H1-type domain-containing protein n=1 Tax=Marchantia polymorpha TaxID=3197 RepID=A0A2R6WA38_MARPO|nr:hypothetical protein MARPO_0121s0050 [Marchantia polymorpha]|eukprot:PTQ30713.1 hypothetical protein MARPO_0121s0050 [Marchantia polymorpha]